METLRIFQSAYNRANWQNTLTTIFGKHVSRINLLQQPQAIEGIDTKIANNAYQLGTLQLTNSTEIALYEVQLCDNIHIQRNRVGIRNLLHREWRYYDGALIVSYQQTTPEWRFSFISETKGWDAEDNWTTLKTQPKRYTYLFGDKNGQYKTPCKRFEELAQTPEIDLAKLKEAFSVEALSKEFYAKLYDWYLWATSDEVGVTFPNDPTTDKDDRDNKNIKTIRLITRVLFCWFIRQKGFIPADLFKQEFAANILRDFPFGIGTSKLRYQEEAFNPTSTTSANYYAAILQNLFFATLNNEVTDRQWANEDSGRNDGHYGVKQLWRDNKGFSFFKDNGKATLEDLLRNIPYMNGGLFECLDKMGEDEKHKTIYYDGFSRDNMRQKRAFVPNALFFNPESEGVHQGLFTLLEQYNFTVEENSANDAQVSLDPELLGRVFENLLAAYNPETQESARKSTGSFYTPRIIVDYMVGESIKQYLRTQCAFLTEEQLNAIINDTKRPKNITDNQCEDIITVLKSIKILDPACGSGAFPMGILLRMVEIIETLRPSHTAYDRYQLKLDIINNCIYGVDIQSIAMLISKLRFFITLICEQDQLDPSKENFGIHTLPNLETKFVAANTLLNADIHSFDTQWEREDLARLQEELNEIRRKQFSAQTRKEKLEYRRQDKKKCAEIRQLLTNAADPQRIAMWQQEIEKLQQERKDYLTPNIVDEVVQQVSLFGDGATTLFQRDINKEKRDEIDRRIRGLKVGIEKELHRGEDAFEQAVQQVTIWDPYDQNLSNPFFDAGWMFGVNDGFDIVIGNPPYVQLQSEGGKYGTLYANCGYNTFARTGDMYCLFYERGYQLLKNSGTLCYITSNKWMRAGYGESTRDFFANKTNPLLLIDFAGTKVFESAVVDTNILLFTKAPNAGQTTCCIANDKKCLTNLSLFIQQNSVPLTFSSSDSWVILSPIEQSIKRKIEAIGTPLKDWDIQINYGIKTGYNEAFIISTEKRDEILANCQTDDERQRTADLIRPILRGRDIKRYGYDWAELWLIWIPWHFPLHLDPTIQGASEKAEREFERLYPAVYNHLLQHKEQLSKRNKAETGIRYEWYALQRWGANYWEDFFKPKIIFQEIVQESSFVIDNNTHFFCNDTCRIIVGSHLSFLLGILNSKLFFYAVKTYYGGGKLGESGVRMKHTFFLDFCCIPYNKDIDNLVIQQQKNMEKEIDRKVYELYGLTEEEIAFIEGVNL